MKEKLNELVELVKANPVKAGLIVGGAVVVGVLITAAVKYKVELPEEFAEVVEVAQSN